MVEESINVIMVLGVDVVVLKVFVCVMKDFNVGMMVRSEWVVNYKTFI